MKLIEINNFAKKVIKAEALPSLLSSLVQEIREQKGVECFLTCATDLTEKDNFRYMFLTIPENKESKRIESKLTILVQSSN